MTRTWLLIAAAGCLVAAARGGASELPTAGTLIANGRIAASGLSGTWRSVSDLGNGRFAVSKDLAMLKTADVFDGRDHWYVEPSGGSHKLDSPFAERRTRTSSWLARFGWLQPAFGGARRSAASIRKEGGRSYHVMTATPPGGEPVELWFDVGTGDLAKAVEQDWFFKRTITMADYRAAHGLRLPYSIVSTDGADEERVAIESYKVETSAPPQSYAAPQQPDDHSVPATGTTVAATVFPQLVFEATVNGRTMPFLFDTGGHSILSPAAAKALGLQVVGGARSGGSGAGTVAERYTKVDKLRIGDAEMRDQFFYVIDLGYVSMERGPKPPLAGLLGLEVVERFITRIDYRAGKMTLLPRDTAVQCPSGWRDIRFTGDMPTVEAAFDGLKAPFTIDTGNNGSTMLYAHWLNQHRLSDRYRKGVEAISFGAGGASRNWVSYARSFDVGGGGVFKHPLVRITNDKGGVALSRSEAGNLGTDTLANYTITFDYARSRICMEYVPGYQRVPFGRAGLRAVKTDADTIVLNLVNEGGPAAAAGLRKDDRIVTVDGRPARSLSGGDLTRAFTQAPGTVVRVRYTRAGKPGDAVITLRELLPLPRD